MTRLWLSLVFGLLFFNLQPHVCSGKPLCHPDERSALLELMVLPPLLKKNSTNCCIWFGVTCDETTGHVIHVESILMRSVGRVFPSNSSLFLLRHLQRLDLSNKGLVDASTIKALTRNLTNLKRLDMSYNDMSSVPLVLFTNLSSSLVSLSLAGCELVGELHDDYFSRFPKLEVLDLSHNNLSGAVPRSLLHLERLTSLTLSSNFFTGRIPEFRDNSNFRSRLRSLRLSINSIGGPIPSWIYGLPYLEELELRRNLFTGEIGEFRSTSLTTLVLSQNKLRGVVPRSIFQQMKLVELDLSSNGFTGTVDLDDISKLQDLQILDLSSNNLSYLSFDDSINVTSPKNMSLKSVRLSNNRLRGNVPKRLWEMGKDSVEYLDLSHNSFTYMDSFLWNKLETLDLSSNLISKTLPILSPYLQIFSMSNNLVSENFPSSICNLKFLMALDLSYNSIHGKIPQCMGNFSEHLAFLNLTNNKLHGIIPWTERNRLLVLDLHSNFFSGPLPLMSCNASNSDAFILYSPLLYLVSNNQFSGEIPASFCNCKSLAVLDLSYNYLSGTIPHCLVNFSQSLQVLDLRRNKLCGTIPSAFARGNALRSLNLNGNRLEGPMPRSLVNCTKIEVLDVGNNELNGTFPDWLEYLPELQVLVLRGNKFQGLIGNPKLGLSFLKLRIMDFSYNEFTGDLPKKYFEKLKAMQTSSLDAKMSYVGEENGYYDYYQDSVIVTMKGFEFTLVRILAVFATIDLSSNYFLGEIPQDLGDLVSLKGLNLSHNMLEGVIPSSLGELRNLEWLDLSSNELVGEIPTELVDIPWLAKLNLSRNHLEGPIPTGKQFNTFSNKSFAGNLNLCGFPLSEPCDDQHTSQPPPTLQQQEGGHSGITSGFNWKIVMMGYASGVVIGLSIGFTLFHSNGKLGWVPERIMEELLYTRATRPKRGNARS